MVNSTEQDGGRLGVDTGGTFTDFVWMDGEGHLHVHKSLSTTHDPAEAIIAGIQLLEVPISTSVVHGSTVATNALLERNGSRTALISTQGFVDVLAIARQDRPELYALVPRKPESLVPKKWRLEVKERVGSDGRILFPLSIVNLQEVVDKLVDSDIESVAICLLFSFVRPEHEQTIRDAIRAREASPIWHTFPAKATPIHISLSSEVLPEFREFERTAATVINAYVAPPMTRYLNRLEQELASRPLKIMQSNGGLLSPQTGGQFASRTVLSGPAGGVVGARYIAEQAGFQRIITIDMGGTSTDVALCPKQLPTTTEGEIAGLPLRLPMIDIHTVGAGGGSLARVDAGGALRVGPQSAGSNPGPVCYGRFQKNIELVEMVTITDANLVLGRLTTEHFLGGSIVLDESSARLALEAFAKRLGSTSAEETAWGIIQVANANMNRALRRISVERGYDPRDFTLVSFGGAGGLHACELAQSLQIDRVLIPTIPGVLSALGMLVSQPTMDYSQTVMRLITDGLWEGGDWLEECFVHLEGKALHDMVKDGYQVDRITLKRQVDLRYQGQAHELTITLPTNKPGLNIAELFHTAHEQRYSYRRKNVQIEAVNVRCSARTELKPPKLPLRQSRGQSFQNAIVQKRDVWFESGFKKSCIIDRTLLQPGFEFTGPAVVFQYDSTTVVPPNWLATVDKTGNLVLTH